MFEDRLLAPTPFQILRPLSLEFCTSSLVLPLRLQITLPWPLLVLVVVTQVEEGVDVDVQIAKTARHVSIVVA